MDRSPAPHRPPATALLAAGAVVALALAAGGAVGLLASAPAAEAEQRRPAVEAPETPPGRAGRQVP